MGSYYLVKIETAPKALYALGKLTDIRDDDFDVIQFFKTAPLEKKLKYVTWGKPEATDYSLLTKKLPLLSELLKGGMLRYEMGIIPDHLHIK